MLHPPVAPISTPRKPSFLQRSASVVSLLAWKDRFESYSGKFLTEASFVSYTSEDDIPYKLARENLNAANYNYGLENDLPPPYPSTNVEANKNPPPFSQHEGQKGKETCFTQDFTALETYLKKKLSIKKKNGCRIADAELETAKVRKWIYELPMGNNLEEFLEAYGIPINKGIDMGDLKQKLKDFIDERLVGVDDVSIDNTEHQNEDNQNDSAVPDWKRQMANLENLAHDDNLEKWIESLDVPYFRPIPETKKEIRKYLNLPDEDAKLSPAPSLPFISEDAITVSIPSTNKEAFTPKWKELIEKMGALKNENELDDWLENLEVPHNVQRAKVHAEIKKFFRHETLENFTGKSIVLQDGHIVKTLWDKFEDSSLLKQVGMVAGTTAVLGLIAVLSTTMLSLAVPAVFAINPFFVEIFAQYFLQRQEVAFNLLNFHAAQAKPLSTAWAKQYVLWKYC